MTKEKKANTESPTITFNIQTTSTTTTTTTSTTTTTTIMPIPPELIIVRGLPENNELFFQIYVDDFNTVEKRFKFDDGKYILDADEVCSNFTEKYPEMKLRFLSRNPEIRKALDAGDFCITGNITGDLGI